MHAKEADLCSVNVFKCKQGFCSVWERLWHLSTVHKSGGKWWQSNMYKIEIRQFKCAIHNLYQISSTKTFDFFDKLTLSPVNDSSPFITSLVCWALLSLFLPGLHSWFHFHHLVRHMYNTDGDLSSLWVALALQEVIDPGLQETAQPRLRQSCLGGQAHKAIHFLFWFDVFNDSQKKQRREIT